MERLELNDRPVYYFEQTDSTNIRAKQEAQAGAADGTVIVADMQTAGKGRRGRSWESPAGTNLYFTLIVKPDFSAEKASMLTLVMALAVAKGIEHTMGNISDKLQIKWPNDIIINSRKVCGILTEMSLDAETPGKIAHVLIGVGINVHKQQFSKELMDKATDIETECGQAVSRKELLKAVLEFFEEYYQIFTQSGDLSKLQELYNSRLVNKGREVRVLDPQGEFTGMADGINETGELCVTLPDGSITRVYAGEVSVRGIYGYV
uniref:biotin--[acetyl-CoA-carboxylase] ligase n=1 Tax=Acetatifactor sp. TaxID=1872090 RepID=UPI0040578020